ncbi:hypothetical protein [Clostridium sp. FP1]|nr:hypothetical protein [Clostridium sp. FP1]MBZ9633564.1 hypothetical protein [Clostridium sp. FP1]
MFNPDFSDAVRVMDSSTSSNNTIFEVIEYIIHILMVTQNVEKSARYLY